MTEQKMIDKLNEMRNNGEFTREYAEIKMKLVDKGFSIDEYEKLNVEYNGEYDIAEIREDGVYIFDNAVNDYVRIGSESQCRAEFEELNGRR